MTEANIHSCQVLISYKIKSLQPQIYKVMKPMYHVLLSLPPKCIQSLSLTSSPPTPQFITRIALALITARSSNLFFGPQARTMSNPKSYVSPPPPSMPAPSRKMSKSLPMAFGALGEEPRGARAWPWERRELGPIPRPWQEEA